MGSCAGLCKLQTLEIYGLSDVEEETPDLLNRMLKGITSLMLRGRTMLCSNIASSTLQCLTVLFSGIAYLPGAKIALHLGSYIGEGRA